MTMIYCTKNESKTLPFTVNYPYKAECVSGGIWKIYGDDMSTVMAPLDGHYLEFITTE